MGCSIDGCIATVIARGWCSKHYYRWSRNGDPLVKSGPRQRLPTPAERFKGRYEVEPSGCWRWRGKPGVGGYGGFSMASAGGKRSELAHRASWMLHIGPIPDGLCVLHKCDNPPCVNPAHLFLGTQLENIADRDAKRRQHHGERSPTAKLNREQVRDIRQELADGWDAGEMAEHYGVDKSTIYSIGRRRTWAWLDAGEAA